MTNPKNTAFFRRDGDWLVGNDSARGPWSEHHCHAGPVAAVVAGAAEQAVPDKQLVRVTASFFRPVPMSGFVVSVEIPRNGRVASTTRITLTDRDGKVVVSAECLLLETIATIPVDATHIAGPNIDEATPGKFGVQDVFHGKPFFGNCVEIAYPPGENGDPGPTTIWMRTPAIIQGEVASPFQRLCPLADCANGYSRNSEFTQISCVNPDLTISVFRLLESDWIAGKGHSIWQSNGLGLTEATLFDESGAVGNALQTLVLRSIKS